MKKQLKKRSINPERKIVSERVPYLVRVGLITKPGDVTAHLEQVIISHDHLLVLCEVLLACMWTEHKYGRPIEERARLLRDIQYVIHLLFEIALAAQFLRRQV